MKAKWETVWGSTELVLSEGILPLLSLLSILLTALQSTSHVHMEPLAASLYPYLHSLLARIALLWPTAHHTCSLSHVHNHPPLSERTIWFCLWHPLLLWEGLEFGGGQWSLWDYQKRKGVGCWNQYLYLENVDFKEFRNGSWYYYFSRWGLASAIPFKVMFYVLKLYYK